jgi:alpha-glucosidase
LSDGTHLSIYEAALTDFASMTIANKEDTRFEVDLVPWSNGDKVRTDSEYLTPWQTIQIWKSAGDLIESNLILNCKHSYHVDQTGRIGNALLNADIRTDIEDGACRNETFCEVSHIP